MNSKNIKLSMVWRLIKIDYRKKSKLAKCIEFYVKNKHAKNKAV